MAELPSNQNFLGARGSNVITFVAVGCDLPAIHSISCSLPSSESAPRSVMSRRGGADASSDRKQAIYASEKVSRHSIRFLDVKI